MSYHLIAFERISQLLYINFPSLERELFPKDLKSVLPLSVVCHFVTSVVTRSEP